MLSKLSEADDYENSTPSQASIWKGSFDIRFTMNLFLMFYYGLRVLNKKKNHRHSSLFMIWANSFSANINLNSKKKAPLVKGSWKINFGV